MTAVLAAFTAALVLGTGARWLAPRIGAMDPPDRGLKPHERPVPWLGGAAVAAGVAVGLAVEGWPVPWGATAAIAGAIALGLADDVVGLPALARLGAQLGLGVLLAAGGVAADPLPGTALAVLGAGVLFAAGVNAVNMVDGMDGLAASAAVVSALGLALAAARAGHEGPSQVAVILAGAAGGFLVHNLPPARLFLGDHGAYLVAAVLAVVVLGQGRTAAQLVGAATCFGFFFLDLLLSVLRRVIGGVPLTAGDRGHLYDQLRSRGLSDRGTLGVCLMIHLSLVAVGVRVSEVGTAAALLTVAVVWVSAVAWLWWSGLVMHGKMA